MPHDLHNARRLALKGALAPTDIFTEAEIATALTLYRVAGEDGFIKTAMRSIVEPVLPRISAALGKESSAAYLAYMLLYTFMQAEEHQQVRTS